VDYNEVFYISDTGRSWNNSDVSVRDKVDAQSSKLKAERWPRFHSTFDIIEAAEKGLLPDKIMMNVHPQRWTDNPVEWTSPGEIPCGELRWSYFTG